MHKKKLVAALTALSMAAAQTPTLAQGAIRAGTAGALGQEGDGLLAQALSPEAEEHAPGTEGEGETSGAGGGSSGSGETGEGAGGETGGGSIGENAANDNEGGQTGGGTDEGDDGTAPESSTEVADEPDTGTIQTEPKPEDTPSTLAVDGNVLTDEVRTSELADGGSYTMNGDVRLVVDVPRSLASINGAGTLAITGSSSLEAGSLTVGALVIEGATTSAGTVAAGSMRQSAGSIGAGTLAVTGDLAVSGGTLEANALFAESVAQTDGHIHVNGDLDTGSVSQQLGRLHVTGTLTATGTANLLGGDLIADTLAADVVNAHGSESSVHNLYANHLSVLGGWLTVSDVCDVPTVDVAGGYFRPSFRNNEGGDTRIDVLTITGGGDVITYNRMTLSTLVVADYGYLESISGGIDVMGDLTLSGEAAISARTGVAGQPALRVGGTAELLGGRMEARSTAGDVGLSANELNAAGTVVLAVGGTAGISVDGMMLVTGGYVEGKGAVAITGAVIDLRDPMAITLPAEEASVGTGGNGQAVLGAGAIANHAILQVVELPLDFEILYRSTDRTYVGEPRKITYVTNFDGPVTSVEMAPVSADGVGAPTVLREGTDFEYRYNEAGNGQAWIVLNDSYVASLPLGSYTLTAYAEDDPATAPLEIVEREPNDFDHYITDGHGQVWKLGGAEPLAFGTNAAEGPVTVRVDGLDLREGVHYELGAPQGLDGIPVHLRPSLLASLGEGRHTLHVTFNDGDTDTAPFSVFAYRINHGDGAVAIAGERRDLHFGTNADYQALRVTVSNERGETDFLSEGADFEFINNDEGDGDQTWVRLTESYMSELPVGDYRITVAFEDGNPSARFSVKPDADVYRITSGHDGSWVIGSNDTLSFGTNATDQPREVRVGERVLTQGVDYEWVSTSADSDQRTIVLTTSLLGRLDRGTYVLAVTFANGSEDAARFLVGPDYEIVHGIGETWTQGTDEHLSFVTNGHSTDLTGVMVGTDQLEEGEDYIVYDGDKDGHIDYVGVQLTDEYLETLDDTRHGIVVQFEQGEADGHFFVAPAAADGDADGGGGTGSGSGLGSGSVSAPGSVGSGLSGGYRSGSLLPKTGDPALAVGGIVGAGALLAGVGRVLRRRDRADG